MKVPQKNIIEYYLKFRMQHNMFLLNKSMPTRKQNEITRYYFKHLKNKEKYFAYVAMDSEIQSVIIAGKDDELGEVSIYIEIISEERYINEQMINQEIIKVIDFYRDKIKFNKLIIRAYSSQNKLLNILNQLGYEFGGHQYFGFVKDALKYYKSKKISNSEIISTAKLKDSNNIIKLTKISHAADKTCRLRNFTSKQLKNLKEMLLKDIKNKSVFLINRQAELIGFIWLLLVGKNEYLIGSIAVHPEYWGKGIANILYNHAFNFMKIHGIKKYYGTSSTKSVMNLAEKLNRKIHSSAYSISV